MKTKIFFTLLLTIVLSSAISAQAPNKSKLDQFFDRLNEKNKAMGSLVLAKDGNVVYTRSIGYSQIDGSERKPLTVETRFRVGSITKMFTAAMLLQLVEEGKLKLTDTLDKFFPQIQNAQKITVAHVLGHRSGIRNMIDDKEFRALALNPATTRDELIDLIAKTAPDFEPGTKYSYSNTGFLLLGVLVEKLTSKSYGEALNERIISKIGLKDTYLGTGQTDAAKNESFSYRYVQDWEHQKELPLNLFFSSGAIISTPKDLVKFIQALFDGKIVSKESLAKMLTVKDNYGLGIDTFTYNGKTFYGHTGGIDNSGAWLAYLPEEKLTLAYTTNAKVYPVAKIVDGIFEIYYNKPFQIPNFEALLISTEILDKYVGIYTLPGTPAKFTITRNGTTLFAQAPGGQSIVPLEATAEDKFKIEPPGIFFEFDAAKKQMIVRRGSGERIFTKEN